MPKNRKRVLQIASELVRQDSDGYYIFELPCTCYVQMDDGHPVELGPEGRIEGEHYIRIIIDLDGHVRRELSNIEY